MDYDHQLDYFIELYLKDMAVAKSYSEQTRASVRSAADFHSMLKSRMGQ